MLDLKLAVMLLAVQASHSVGRIENSVYFMFLFKINVCVRNDLGIFISVSSQP